MSDELREKVARVLANAMGEIGDDVWKFYLREADAAIALVSGEQAARIEQLEAALRAAYEVYAGSEGSIAQTCAEGYQRQIITKMVGCISSALDAPA